MPRSLTVWYIQSNVAENFHHQVQMSLTIRIRIKGTSVSNFVSCQPTTHFTVAYSMSREVGTSTSRGGQASTGTYVASDELEVTRTRL